MSDGVDWFEYLAIFFQPPAVEGNFVLKAVKFTYTEEKSCLLRQLSRAVPFLAAMTTVSANPHGYIILIN